MSEERAREWRWLRVSATGLILPAMALTEKTAALAKQWLEWDYNAPTHAEIKTLVDAGDEKELAKRLHQRIDFGTAGTREVIWAFRSSLMQRILLPMY